MRAKTGTGTVRVGRPAAKKAVALARTPDPSKAPAPKARPKKATVRIFVSYSHANAAAQEKLQIHLAALKRDEVETWFDGDMNAGDKLSTEISAKLRAANVFVALMSPEYIHSHWCQLEYRRAMGRRARGSMRVVVVVLRHCDWKATGASELKVLPRDGRPVSNWRTMDEAFNDVTQGIRGAVRAVRSSLNAAAKAQPAKVRRVMPKEGKESPKGGAANRTKARPGSGTKRAKPTQPARSKR